MLMEAYRRNRAIDTDRIWPDLMAAMVRNRLSFEITRTDGEKGSLFEEQLTVEQGVNKLCTGLFNYSAVIKTEWEETTHMEVHVLYVDIYFELESDLELVQKDFMIPYKLSLC